MPSATHKAKPDDIAVVPRRPQVVSFQQQPTTGVTEQDFLQALAQEIAPTVRRPFEFTVTEIMAVVERNAPPGTPTPNRGVLRSKLDALVTKGVLSSRKGYFEAGKDGDGDRREQWAYTILNPAGKKPFDLFPGTLLALSERKRSRR